MLMRARRIARGTTRSLARSARDHAEAIASSASRCLHPPIVHDRQDPDVSVVVTTQNRPDLLERALRSVQLQRHVDAESVVVDDGSDQLSSEANREVARRIPNCRLIRHPQALGLSAARNTGIMNSRAEFICFLDDDDHLCWDSLTRRLRVLTADRSASGVYSDWISIPDHRHLGSFRPLRRARARPSIDGYPDMTFGAPFIASAPLLRREVLIAAGGFNERLRRVEDAELWARLSRSGHRIPYVPHIGAAYRQSPATMAGAEPEAQLDALLAVSDWLDADIPIEELGPGPLPTAETLSSVRRRQDGLPLLMSYLALMHLRDCEQAQRRARELIPQCLRTESRLSDSSRSIERTLQLRGGVCPELARQSAQDFLNHLAQLDAAPSSRTHVTATLAGLHREVGTYPGALPTHRSRLAHAMPSGREIEIELDR